MRPLPPLEPSFDPILIRTNRRLELQTLINVLYRSILRKDAARASRAWAILIRCPEIDLRTCWQWPLAVLDLQEREALQAAAERDGDNRASQDAVLDIRNTREKFLRRMQVTVRYRRRPEVLLELVLHLIRVEQYAKALDLLDLYLASPPYIWSPILHVYAGLIVLYLAQPLELRGKSVKKDSQDLADRSHSTPPSSPSSSSSTRSSAASGAAAVDRLHSKLDRRKLFKALAFFEKAIEVAENDGSVKGAKCEIAEVYKARVQKYLQAGGANGGSDDDDDDMDTTSSFSVQHSDLENAARASVATDTHSRRSTRSSNSDGERDSSSPARRPYWDEKSGSDDNDDGGYSSSSEPDDARTPTRATFSKSQSQSLGGIGFDLQAMAINSQAAAGGNRLRSSQLAGSDKDEDDEEESEMEKSEYSDDLSVG